MRQYVVGIMTHATILDCGSLACRNSWVLGRTEERKFDIMIMAHEESQKERIPVTPE